MIPLVYYSHQVCMLFAVCGRKYNTGRHTCKDVRVPALYEAVCLAFSLGILTFISKLAINAPNMDDFTHIPVSFETPRVSVVGEN